MIKESGFPLFHKVLEGEQGSNQGESIFLEFYHSF